MFESMKTETKSLYELGEEYEKHAELQNHFINGCKAEIKKAKKSGDFDAVMDLEKKLKKFLAIKRELQENAATLKNYYRVSSGKSKENFI